MKKYVRTENSLVVEVFERNDGYEPVDCFTAEVANQFIAAPTVVHVGWRLINGEWLPPEPVQLPELETSDAIRVSPVEFKLLFTPQERMTIKAARATDPVIDDFCDIVEDPRLTHVDLGLKSTKDALAYMVNSGLIAAERQGEILAGKMQ